MGLSLHEEWSPELLNELQRAVPVLESGSLDEERGRRPDWPPSSDDRGLRWGGWAQEARRDGDALQKPDLLSEGAMALPMSTMTSGKRKIYPNRSTFQAHVCCVMDPLQVPRVLESLQGASAGRSWPFAYRIISPFDGQVHVGCEDDKDPGAGEKMLGLLERMGLENLLLVVCHWNAGGHNRLGGELFKCVTEQCKDLLKELQQAVRASFPPELLARGDETAAAMPALEDERTASSTESFGSELQMFAEEVGTSRHVDLSSIGATPPPELMYASRGVCIQPTSRRKWPPPGGPGGREGVDAPVVGSAFKPKAANEARKSAKGEARAAKANSEAFTFMTEGDVAEGVDFNELSNEELERLCRQMESERASLDASLSSLGNCEAILKPERRPRLCS